MSRHFHTTLLIAVCGLAAAAHLPAAVPQERDVQRHSTVQFYGSQHRPIGAIDFSSTAGGSRRFGPWDVEMDARQAAEGIIIHDDGSVYGDARERRYRPNPDAGRTCTTHDNLTVCR
jgi:hypothetical protein